MKKNKKQIVLVLNFLITLALLSGCATQGKSLALGGAGGAGTGAIVGGTDDTAAAKMKIMAECGIYVVESPAEIGSKMVEALSAKAN